MDSSSPCGVIMHPGIKTEKEESEMNHNVVGLDIAKNVFHLYSLGPDGKVIKKSSSVKNC
jgi:hypothetical protein